jgi:hypothetical protein
VLAISGSDDVVLDPLINEYGSVSTAIDSNYVWNGPNNFTYTGRVLNFDPVKDTDQVHYSVTYTNEFGCSDSKTYTITTDNTLLVNTFEIENFGFSQILSIVILPFQNLAIGL